MSGFTDAPPGANLLPNSNTVPQDSNLLPNSGGSGFDGSPSDPNLPLNGNPASNFGPNPNLPLPGSFIPPGNMMENPNMMANPNLAPVPNLPLAPAGPNLNTQEKKLVLEKENHTLYINNINDRINTTILRNDLLKLFAPFGKVLDLVAMRSFWRRGQAWVVFDRIEEAKNALQTCQGKVMYGKPLRINFAIEKSDTIAKREGVFRERPKGPKKPKQVLKRELEMLSALQQSLGGLPFGLAPGVPPVAPFAPSAGFDGPPVGASSDASGANLQTSPKPPADASTFGRRYAPQPHLQIPPHNQVKNHILFVSNIPSGVTNSDVVNIFNKMPGYADSRIILAKNVAFIEFDNDQNSTYCLNLLQGYHLNGQLLSITYAKH